MENFGKDQDHLKDVKFDERPVHVDFQRLMEMANSEKGVSHMQYFMKHWEYKRDSTVQVLEEELDLLCRQREEIEQKIERKRQQILEKQGIHDESSDTVKGQAPVLDEGRTNLPRVQELKTDAEHAQFEGLSALLKRADFFLHLILQSAPVVIAHQDADLRYRFVFNHYPTLADEDVIGKTDYEIFSGEGIEEMNSVKREVMATGIATKREFTFNTPMFGEKIFVVYIEPVFSKAGETIGVNHVAMDVTDQVKRRNKMMDIRVREAIQKATES